MAKSKLNANLSMIGNYPKKNPVKCAIVALFLLLALIGLIISKGVKINYSLSDYLNEDTETSIALEIMSEEFGMTGNVQVMLTGIDKETANAVKEDLSAIEGVLNVSFDAYNPSNYKEETKSALFTILINGEDHSDTAKAVMQEIKTTLGDKYGTVELGGSTVEYNALRENTSGEMGLIVVLSVAMAAVLLLITASSWIEPIILLGCSGIAIAINMGLNVFLGEISYITKSVSSILQLALSVDYSIVLLHAYRDKKKTQPDDTAAMRSAVKAVLNPVSASALTTIAGLVALLFMSFTIGFDIGIVLIKGIVVSAITAMIFLPVVVLMLDGLIKKTAKRPFVPKGDFFSNFATKFGKFVAPVAAVLIISGSVLQSFNGYGFTDSIGSNKNIESTFGRSDTVVVVYPNSINKNGLQGEYEDYRKEMLLKEAMDKYTNEKGEKPVSSYTAYATTVREIYDLDKAVKVLGLPENDVKMLFAMYNIYNDDSSLQLTPYEFIRYTDALINSGDPDVSSLVDEGTKKTIALLNSVADLSTKSYTATELLNKLNSISAESGISEFAIKQMYGMYFYDKIAVADKTINTHALCTYLSANISRLPISDGQSTGLTIALNRIKGKVNADQNLTHTEFYQYCQTDLITSLITLEQAEQFYIMYLVDKDAAVGNQKLSECQINGREFIDYVLEVRDKNETIKSQLTPNVTAQLNDLITTADCLSETKALGYADMTLRMNKLKEDVQSMSTTTKLQKNKISGVYIKYGAEFATEAAMKPMQAVDLVSFIKINMYSNPLLAGKMNESHFEKIVAAENMMTGARELFISDTYSRILISAKIPAEGPEMVAFIDYLLQNTQEIFGEDAHITGKVVSTYDLQAAFDVDNLIITLFTIISILLVILVIFKSASLPVILVLVIQGSVWISLSFCLVGGDLIFFMSYIVTTCILMGATVDYGILMSNNYLVYRKTDDKKVALRRAVDSAMPTVFTSGLILVICGFVISLISSQNSIASVGTLLAQGTLVSIVMITLGLPSILFVLDKYILKLTMNDSQKAACRAKFNSWILKFKATKFGGAVFKILYKINDVLSLPFKKMIEEKKKKQLVAERLQRAKEKRAITLAAKKKAKEEAALQNPPKQVQRKTARSILKAMADSQNKKATEVTSVELIEPKALESEASSHGISVMTQSLSKTQNDNSGNIVTTENSTVETTASKNTDVPQAETDVSFTENEATNLKADEAAKPTNAKSATAKSAAKNTVKKTNTAKNTAAKSTSSKTSSSKTEATKSTPKKSSSSKPKASEPKADEEKAD